MYWNLMDMTMGMKIAIVMAVVTFSWFELSSQVQVELEGGLSMGQSPDNNPEPGTIRWTGNDLEGWNGIIWVSLTGGVLDTVSDITGNIYKTLKIGNDIWMIENLRTTRLNDGIILGDPAPAGWSSQAVPYRCRYNNSDANIIPYGFLYNGYAAEDDRLCPTGWHVSTVEEWETLIDLMGGAATAGGPLKESGTQHWSPPNTDATNESGLAALPGGNRKPDASYTGLMQYGNYWAIDLIGLSLKDYNFEYNTADVTQLTITDRKWGLSVRCVKNQD
ncbi:MAG: fibrobacter succinogenes major paralogous domain-containing protein [Saprospiraceae bacterium]|nr:fibrobacter succinogenes major paralogous domain-containing protein [Saprospiraceae bacterium]